MSEKRRYNGRRIFVNVLWSLLGLATVVLLGAAISLRNHKKCKAVNITISGAENNFFIDKKEIAGILENVCGGTLPGRSLGSFNLALIENTLEKNQWIKNAELFFDNNEVLRVEVVERDPVARIFTNTGTSFYLDSTLTRLPLSDKSTARVPVFSNFPAQAAAISKADSSLLKEIKDISSYILKDPFWMAQIDQVDITPERTFEMVPKVGNQIIFFGNADNYQQKFDNLLTFYKQVATKVGWNTYSKINVQYKDQVVAVKRGEQDIVQDLLRTKQMMQSIVISMQQKANDSIGNVQLVQPQDDNIIPVAPQLDDIPDEKAIDNPKTVAPVNTISSSNERPDPTLAKTVVPEKTTVTEKTPVAAKKIFSPAEKPFWLQSATTKPKTSKVVKRTNPKSKSTSNGKPNPIPLKKVSVVKSSTTKTVNKAPIKKITKPIIQSTTKPKTKPKAVLPPKNDY